LKYENTAVPFILLVLSISNIKQSDYKKFKKRFSTCGIFPAWNPPDPTIITLKPFRIWLQIGKQFGRLSILCAKCRIIDQSTYHKCVFIKPVALLKGQ
jgi:hypothetical protein